MPDPTCPHCGSALLRFSLPDESGWQDAFHRACFNDDCPYFRRGWVWMFEQFGVKSSYRYRLDPNGNESPLAVWSKTAIRDRILEDDAASPSGEGGVIRETGEPPPRNGGEGGEGI